MKLDLEKYLEKNRQELDAETPDDTLIWQGIRQGIKNDRQVLSNWFWKAAAIFLLGVLSTYIVINKTEKTPVVVVTLADISQELGRQEAELKLIADRKWEEIKPLLPTENNELQFLLDELKELDVVYVTYREDLYKTGVNEQITQVLLDYYEKKIRILNRLLLEIQKQKNYEKTVTL